MRLRTAFLVSLLALAPVGASAHHVEVAPAVSDSDAFGTYLAEYTAQVGGAVDLYIQYSVASDAAEKSDAAKAAQDALLITQEHMAGLDVRECFAPFDEVVTEFLDTLVRSFEEALGNPIIAGALDSYAATLYGTLTDQIPATVLACAPAAVDA